jgi:hypothetical protein
MNFILLCLVILSSPLQYLRRLKAEVPGFDFRIQYDDLKQVGHVQFVGGCGIWELIFCGLVMFYSLTL